MKPILPYFQKRRSSSPLVQPIVGKLKNWLECARRRDIVLYSTRTALFVGTLLMIINHGDKLWLGQLTRTDWFKIGLTYLVPYLVSTWSSVATFRRRHDT